MWLLNTRSRKLEHFTGDTPRYAILSHRWQDSEAVFKSDAIYGLDDTKPSAKINSCCLQALKDGYSYVWIDTCCIDKRSSSELSEAINSMYRWYSESAQCYVYMFDVESSDDLERSAWFSRSWTLQELLAPPQLTFFNCHWRSIGTKASLLRELCQITKIPQRAFEAFIPQEYNIAEKMSWASGRSALRQEDIAYSLLGIFEVNMPLLYGESAKAFQRLQEELLKTSGDLSIFAWSGGANNNFGMLADSPSSFHSTLRMEPSVLWRATPSQEGFIVNNAGISIDVWLKACSLDIYLAYMLVDTPRQRFSPIWKASPKDTEHSGLGCIVSGSLKPGLRSQIEFGIFLQRDTCYEHGFYRRVCVGGEHGFFNLKEGGTFAECEALLVGSPVRRKVFIARLPMADLDWTDFGFKLRIKDFNALLGTSDEGNEAAAWICEPPAVETEGHLKIMLTCLNIGSRLACIRPRLPGPPLNYIYFYFGFDFEPVCLVSWWRDSQSTPDPPLSWSEVEDMTCRGAVPPGQVVLDKLSVPKHIEVFCGRRSPDFISEFELKRHPSYRWRISLYFEPTLFGYTVHTQHPSYSRMLDIVP